MLFGRYEHTLDDKGRLMIPSKFRSELGSTLYIMKGYDGALSIYKQSTFESLSSEIESYSFEKRNSRAFIRTRLSSTYELEVDKLGRITLPSALLSRYGIGKDVIVLGVNDHMEIWDRDKYLEYESKCDASDEETAENLVKDEDNDW
ncbi:MAG: division/cell wall cluster transcriptional repressor MraZ [Coprobacillus sp.]|nr:division/cell wall cluster transcriptional repressor MraZ [Coprobacillus sp.]